MNIDNALLLQILVTRWLLLFLAVFIVGEPVKWIFPKLYAWYSDYWYRTKYKFISIELRSYLWFRGYWVVFYLMVAAYHCYMYYNYFGSALIAFSTGMLVSAGIVGLIRYYGRKRNVYAQSTYSVVTIAVALLLIHFLEPWLLARLLPYV
ncbi:MAG: hypothetical protein KBD26_01280 [Candidatus Pacebacteria bacterium]|nr:hypothetical protein [Candidatus Paceibacterota bacterium]MBP9772441.1 hypothetical protein [Candidatus Paceibacterota bacterium]